MATDIQADGMELADLVTYGLAHTDPVVRALARALEDAPDAEAFEDLKVERDDLTEALKTAEDALHDAGVDLA